MILEAQADFEVVGEAGDGAEALDLVRATSPDVVLMDVRMPGMDGLEATRQLMASESDTCRVLMLTTFDTDEYLYEAFRAGASGFLLKTAPPARLVEAVRLVVAGEALVAPSITRRLIESYVRLPRHDNQSHPKLATLTDRELGILRLIARGQSNREIGESTFISEATVKTHANRIFSKLQLRDRVQAVVLAYECGLVEPGGPPAS